jgi:hypothetical protein
MAFAHEFGAISAQLSKLIYETGTRTLPAADTLIPENSNK